MDSVTTLIRFSLAPSELGTLVLPCGMRELRLLFNFNQRNATRFHLVKIS